MALELRSPAFGQGEDIPKRYTCDGENRSPPLAWTGVPEGTRSFVLFCNDPDAPVGLFHHWVAWDIPGDWRELKAGYGPESLEDGFRQGINSFGRPGYGGPCPPKGHGPHHYHFRLCAVSEATLSLEASADYDEVLEAAKPYILDEAELIGIYER